MTKEEKIKYYQDKYFIGMEANGKKQLLHFNKTGYELRNEINKKVVIFSENNIEHSKRFKTIGTGPFRMCYKIPCLEYYFGEKPTQENFKTKLLHYLRKIVWIQLNHKQKI
ncbi:MAG: hypothetical protein K0B10_07210 [Vicingaceae bacterium]|nr:hypothetical protein [Vicingaceae bacterium]